MKTFVDGFYVTVGMLICAAGDSVCDFIAKLFE
jgi:hypothetical protein